MEVAAADIKQLGGSVQLVDIGTQKVGGMGAFLGGSAGLVGIGTQKVGGMGAFLGGSVGLVGIGTQKVGRGAGWELY